jgi:hypothetical protein
MPKITQKVKTLLFPIFALLLLQGFLPGGTGQTNSQQAMLSYAGKVLPGVLTQIPVDLEKNYGFFSRDEFIEARLGIPYQEFSLESEGPTGIWRIPVTVNGENRALLTLMKQDGKWAFMGFGAAVLAKELGKKEKAYLGGSPLSGRIVRDFSRQCDYVQLNPEGILGPDTVLTPLTSAYRHMPGIAGLSSGGTTLDKIKQLRIRLMKAQRPHQEDEQ